MPADKGIVYIVQLSFRALLWKLWVIVQHHNVTSQLCSRPSKQSSFKKEIYAVLKWEKHDRLENKYVSRTTQILEM